MKKDEVIEITQKEAIIAIKNIKDSKVHCFIGFLGADWEKKSVIDLIKRSKRIAWADNMFNHNLAIINDGRLYNFDVKK
jgi:hypothetical protein